MRKYFEHDNVNESLKYIGASKRKPGKKIAYIAVTTALTLGAFFCRQNLFPENGNPNRNRRNRSERLR